MKLIYETIHMKPINEIKVYCNISLLFYRVDISSEYTFYRIIF